MAIEIVLHDDVRFQLLSRGQNARFPKKDSDRVSRIALCENSEDVAEVLERFVSAGLRPTVRAGGHCYEDFVDNNPQGAIIDLSRLTGTTLKLNAPKYCLGAGTTLEQAYLELFKRELVTIPGGTCAGVGVGGHIAGGGYGLLSRQYGITSDWVTAVDIVTLDCSGNACVRRADKTNDTDLLRACRGGGGGNFGIITNFYFDILPKVPTEVLKGIISFGWDEMTEERFIRILHLFSNYWETRGTNPETWGLFSIFNLSHRSSGRLSISVTFTNLDGTVNDTDVVAEYLALFDECKAKTDVSIHPVTALDDQDPAHMRTNLYVGKYPLQKMGWIDLQESDGDAAVWTINMRHKYKSSYMKRAFTREESACFYKHLNRTIPGIDLSRNRVLADSFGGAVNRKQMLEQTASAQRSSILKLQFIGTWTNAAEDAAQIQWLRDFYTELYATSTAGTKYRGVPFWSTAYEGCYINYPDVDMLKHNYWPQLYYGTGDLFPFLQNVKRKYDPNNVFRHAMSIPL